MSSKQGNNTNTDITDALNRLSPHGRELVASLLRQLSERDDVG